MKVCPTCHGNGYIKSGLYRLSESSLAGIEPITEACPECDCSGEVEPEGEAP